jgi:hypothetical protein
MPPPRGTTLSGTVTRHIEFLTRLFDFWSAFNAIVCVAVLAFAAAAAELALSSGADRAGTEVAAGITAATLVVVALAAGVWAGAHFYCARAMRRRRPWGRFLGLALGLFNLPLLPLGTALGGYAIWTLLHEESRRLFGGT